MDLSDLTNVTDTQEYVNMYIKLIHMIISISILVMLVPSEKSSKKQFADKTCEWRIFLRLNVLANLSIPSSLMISPASPSWKKILNLNGGLDSGNYLRLSYLRFKITLANSLKFNLK